MKQLTLGSPKPCRPQFTVWSFDVSLSTIGPLWFGEGNMVSKQLEHLKPEGSVSLGKLLIRTFKHDQWKISKEQQTNENADKL